MENQVSGASPKKNFFPVIIFLVVAVAGVSGYLFLRSNQNKDQSGQVNDEANQKLMPITAPEDRVVNTPVVTSSTAPVVTNTPAVATVKTFNVSGSNFNFSLTEIKVRKGDRVKIIFKNTDGFHDWVIDEFNAKTARIQAGQTAEVEFVADKVGTFEYYCSVGSHRANGMKGNLVVE